MIVFEICARVFRSQDSSPLQFMCTSLLQVISSKGIQVKRKRKRGQSICLSEASTEAKCQLRLPHLQRKLLGSTPSLAAFLVRKALAPSASFRAFASKRSMNARSAPFCSLNSVSSVSAWLPMAAWVFGP